MRITKSILALKLQRKIPCRRNGIDKIILLREISKALMWTRFS
jgi:hypothetical protein